MPEPLTLPGRPINGPSSIFCCDLHSFICGWSATVPVSRRVCAP